MISETLKKIVEGTPGAQGAIIMGFDGIAIDSYKTRGAQDVDLDTIVTEFSFRFDELRKAADSLDLGGLSDVTVKTERATILLRVLSQEFFAVVLLGDAKGFGQGRWQLRSKQSQIMKDL
ncbi:MAG: roadblock/LC7 domain-containing protein [Myxococcales bacterium]|nr:roadblock/LC7 domain-containing protein [Myxococcales bacterium]